MICTTNHHIAFGFFSFSTRLKQKLVLRPKPNLLSKPRFKLSSNQTRLKDLAYFKSSGLLCWRSDLVFSNLRVHFLNTLKALHLCWAAVRNHKVVAFVGFNQDLLSQAWHGLMCDLFKSRSLKRDIYPSVSRAFWWSRPVARLHNGALRLTDPKVKLRKLSCTPKGEMGAYTVAMQGPKVRARAKVRQSAKESAITSNKANQNSRRLNPPKFRAQAKFNFLLRCISVCSEQPYALLNQLSRYVKQLTRKISRRNGLKTSSQVTNTNGAKSETFTVFSPLGEIGKSATLGLPNQTRDQGVRPEGLRKPGLGQRLQLKHPKSALAYARLQSKMDFNNSCLNAFMYNLNFTGFFSNPELSFKTNLNHYKDFQTGLNDHRNVKDLKNHDHYGLSNLLKRTQKPGFLRSKAKITQKSKFLRSRLGLSLAKPRSRLTQAQHLSKKSFGLGLYGFSAHVVNLGLSPVTNFEVQAYKRLNSKLKLKTSKFVDSDLLNPRLDLNTALAAKNSKTFSTTSSFLGLSLANIRSTKPRAQRASASGLSFLKNFDQNLSLFYLKTNPPWGSPKGDHRNLNLVGRLRVEAKKINPKSVSLKSRLPKINIYDQGVLKNLGAEFNHFVINPNLKQADLIFFSNPNKTPGLAKQARYLNIPTLGLMSGLRSSQNPCGAQIVPNVNFGILGNPENGWLNFNIVCTFLSVSLKASTWSNTKSQFLKAAVS